jgi:CubicO group peptidase (beta-lactamase class C family)
MQPVRIPGYRVFRRAGTLAVVMLLAVAASAPLAAARPHPAEAALASCGSPTVEMPADLPLLQQPAVASAVQSTLSALGTARDADQVPGFSVVVVHDQDVVFSAGFGCADLARQTPVTPETLFLTNSLTKLFTDVMLMQLRDAGSLSLNDPVNRYNSSAQYLSPERPAGLTHLPSARRPQLGPAAQYAAGAGHRGRPLSAAPD